MSVYLLFLPESRAGSRGNTHVDIVAHDEKSSNSVVCMRERERGERKRSYVVDLTRLIKFDVEAY